jgi:hypothetical protein
VIVSLVGLVRHVQKYSAQMIVQVMVPAQAPLNVSVTVGSSVQRVSSPHVQMIVLVMVFVLRVFVCALKVTHTTIAV